jgi:hypothetical protein
MFMVGEVYKSKEGFDILITDEANVGTPYHCAMGIDGIWRYARQHDAGRVTGSAFDMSNPRNLVPPHSINPRMET